MNQTEKEEKTVASHFFINYYPAPSYFNDFHEKMSFKEALAILPKDTRISLDTTGSLTINGHTRDEFVAHGCPYKPIDDNGNTWVIYGIVSADEPDRGRGLPDSELTFEGTAEFENTVYTIKFSGGQDYDEIFKKVKGEVTLTEDTYEKIRVYLRDEVLPLYPRDVHIRKI